MNRRQFLKLSAPIASLPLLLNGLSVKAYARTALTDRVFKTAVETDRIFVLLQMSGGNDGLNTVIPLDQYSAYQAARPNIALPESSLSETKLADSTALHPAMTDMKALYDEGMLAVVQGVSYPNPNLSHFRATDIWLSAADYNQYLETGWLGRYLDYEYPGFPTGYPTQAVPDPVAIQISSVVLNALQGLTASTGTAITNPNGSFLAPSEQGQPPNSLAGTQVAYVRAVNAQTQQYTSVVKTAYNATKNLSDKYPARGTNYLADQFAIIARLIAGGLKTRVYVANIGGFDTHSGQVTEADPTTGEHATLLGNLSSAIGAFMDDLNLLGVGDRVVGMTFTEFGRRIKSNASYGTDHGTSEPVFIFGSKINGGVYGTNPMIPTKINVNDNLGLQYDFRQLYSSVLGEWFGAGSDELTSTLQRQFDTLPIFNNLTGVTNQNVPGEFRLFQSFPNPFNPSTIIRYEIPSSQRVVIRVYDDIGREVTTLVDGFKAAGTHEVEFNARGLASGVYFYRIQTPHINDTKKMVYIK